MATFAGDLNQSVVKEKWDKIRIVCSQPFKRDLQFGLSFLKFYTTDTEETQEKFPASAVSASSRPSPEISSPKLLIVPKDFRPKQKNNYSSRQASSDESLLQRLSHTTPCKGSSKIVDQTSSLSRPSPSVPPPKSSSASNSNFNPDSPRFKFLQKINGLKDTKR